MAHSDWFSQLISSYRAQIATVHQEQYTCTVDACFCDAVSAKLRTNVAPVCCVLPLLLALTFETLLTDFSMPQLPVYINLPIDSIPAAPPPLPASLDEQAVPNYVDYCERQVFIPWRLIAYIYATSPPHPVSNTHISPCDRTRASAPRTVLPPHFLPNRALTLFRIQRARSRARLVMTFVPPSPISLVRRAVRLWSGETPAHDKRATPPTSLPARMFSIPPFAERREAGPNHGANAADGKWLPHKRNDGGSDAALDKELSPLLSLPSLPSSSSSSAESSFDHGQDPVDLFCDETATLYDVILPGTHDSAAYTARPDLVSRLTPTALRYTAVRTAVTHVQTDFALTQTLTVFEQLRAGARFLDIRVTKRPGDERFWTHHGMVLCTPLAIILDQINQFHEYILARKPSSQPLLPHVPVVSVFRASALTEGEHRALAAFVRGRLKHSIYAGDARSLRTTPLRKLPCNIVAGLHASLLDLSWGTDVWVDTYVADTKISFLKKTLHASVPRLARNSLLILGWTVTPSAVDIVLRVLTRGILRPSVLASATRLNLRFHHFANTHSKQLKLSTNVVFFDAFSVQLASKVLSLNRIPLNCLSVSSVSSALPSSLPD